VPWSGFVLHQPQDLTRLTERVARPGTFRGKSPTRVENSWWPKIRLVGRTNALITNDMTLRDPASASFFAPAQKAHFSALKAYFFAEFLFPKRESSCTLRY